MKRVPVDRIRMQLILDKLDEIEEFRRNHDGMFFTSDDIRITMTNAALRQTARLIKEIWE